MMSDDLDNSIITICHLCKSVLSNPRILPCYDYFCLDCLENYGKGTEPGEMAECPDCRKPFAVPAGGFASLPANAFVDRLLARRRKNVHQPPPDNVPCDVCRVGEDVENSAERSPPSSMSGTPPATFYCSSCRQNICDACRAYHVKFAGTKGHHLETIGRGATAVAASDGGKDQPSPGGPPSTADRCDRHGDESVEMYCRDCDAALCIRCFCDKHNAHTCCDIRLVAAERRRQISDEMDDVGWRLAAETESEIEYLHAATRRINDEIDRAELDVLRKKEELVRSVESGAQELMNDLANLRQMVRTESDETEVGIRKRLDRMVHFRKYAAAALHEGSASVVAGVAVEMRKRADEIRETHRRLHVAPGRRPTVQVNVESTGLAGLATASERRRINLVGRITAHIISPVLEKKVEDSRKQQQQQPDQQSNVDDGNAAAKAVPISAPKCAEFTADAAAKKVGSSGRRLIVKPVRRQAPQTQSRPPEKSAATFRSFTLCGVRGLPTAFPVVIDSQGDEFTDDEPLDSDDDDDVVGRMRDLQSGKECDGYNAVSQGNTGNEATSLSSVEKKVVDTSDEKVLLVYPSRAKLYRFKDGMWRDRGVGLLKILKYGSTGVITMMMNDVQTQKILLTRKLTAESCLESMPESDGREWTWASSDVSDDRYEMYSLRFASKDSADRFKVTFDSAKQLAAVRPPRFTRPPMTSTKIRR